MMYNRKLVEFAEKLKEFGLGDFEIKERYERNYYDPVYRVHPEFYVDGGGYLRRYSNPRVICYEVYNKVSGEHVRDFYHSMEFVEYLLRKQEVYYKDQERFFKARCYFGNNSFK